MIYTKDELQLSSTVGQGQCCSIPVAVYHIMSCALGESGLVYKAYLDTAIGKEIVAVKTGKGKIFHCRPQMYILCLCCSFIFHK